MTDFGEEKNEAVHNSKQHWSHQAHSDSIIETRFGHFARLFRHTQTEMPAFIPSRSRRMILS